jgi:predicted nucleic acid-binding protein
VTPLLSVPLLMEYEEVLKRPGLVPHLSASDIETVLDQLASRAVAQRIHFLWRPFLPDPDDDMLVELALAGQASHITTSNVRDLAPARTLGLEVVTPAEFIRQFGLS